MEAWQDRMQPVACDLLDTQVREQKSFHAEVHQYRPRIEDFNNMTQDLISSYPSDDASKIKKIAESINQRFCLLSNYAMARGKEIHGGLSSSNSLLSSIDEFSSWMSATEMKLEALHKEVEQSLVTTGAPGTSASAPAADPALATACQDLATEVEQHRDIYLSLDSTGKKLVSGLDTQEDATLLHTRLEQMNQRWSYLKAKSIAIRSRLENTAEDWSSLLVSLRDLNEWVGKQEAELLGLSPVGGDEVTIRKQQEDTRLLRRTLVEKRPVIENKLLTGRQLLASETAPSDTSDSDMSRETESTVSGPGSDAENAQLARCVRREVAKLSDKWSALLTQLDTQQRRLDDTLPKVHTFQASLESVLTQLCEAEVAQKSLTNCDTDPNTFRNQLKSFSASLSPLQRLVEDINDQASDFTANSVALSRQILQRLEDINTRWKLVQLGLDDHYKRLNEVRGKDRMPHTQDFLAVAVQAPWARAISQNGVPYYINHQTETTHWDHPEMVNTFKSLMQFNTIRFSAYRTSMKIRELQKKLSLHLLSLNVAIEAFDAHGLRGQNERMLDVGDMVTILGSLYETISAANPTSVNVPLCLDLTLNWLLNVYDCQRTGQLRVLSFKIAITIMCKGPLEEKYRYMFRLIADQARKSNQRKLGLLLSDCIQVPRVLGEAQAFGGTNVEPSVRSCFEAAGDHEFIEALNFLNWMKQEPQSMVWLPVLHRFTAAETARHQAKCNICKQNPIQGFRYRCLKCFNFDMCQECFFAGKGGRYKNHKMTHPMQEYCTNTTSGEDVRDFTRLLRNKLMSSSKKKKTSASRLGYLPVQTLDPDTLVPDSPSLSPGRSVSRQETSERLDIASARLSEIETRSGSDESASRQVTPQQHSEPTRVNTGSPLTRDEHSLIAVYCQKLQEGQLASLIPDSPMQVAVEIDAEQRKELEFMIKELEMENANLKEEYNHLKIVGCQMPSLGAMTLNPPDVTLGGPVINSMNSTEAEMLAEAAMLREHRARLENRMTLLEEHNRQLESQLGKLKQILEPGSVGGQKTGTLTTKSVTASQLAQDSPVLPHKLLAPQQPPAAPAKVPPAVPPRTTPAPAHHQLSAAALTSLTNGLATIKRSTPRGGDQSGQARLEEVFRASTLSRRGGGADSGRIPFRREASVPRAGAGGSAANWTDSLPRKDLLSLQAAASNTNSLPRRDKAGLGRPEPGPPTKPKPALEPAPAPSTAPARDVSLERSNPFRDTFLGADKRSSTGNLFFTDQFDNHPWEAPPDLQPPASKAPAWPPRRRNLSTASNQERAEGPGAAREDRDPATTLQAMAGNVGKELNQLISLMNSEDTETADTAKNSA